MNKQIENLTLLLMYLTSWEEKLNLDTQPNYRTWKGYCFEIINELERKGLISQGRKSKSVYLTKEGISQAERLKKMYEVVL